MAQGLLIIDTTRSHSHTAHSVGLLWTSDQPVTETSTWQHTTLTTDRHPCPGRNSNPQSQEASGRRDEQLLSGHGSKWILAGGNCRKPKNVNTRINTCGYSLQPHHSYQRQLPEHPVNILMFKNAYILSHLGEVGFSQRSRSRNSVFSTRSVGNAVLSNALWPLSLTPALLGISVKWKPTDSTV